MNKVLVEGSETLPNYQTIDNKPEKEEWAIINKYKAIEFERMKAKERELDREKKQSYRYYQIYLVSNSITNSTHETTTNYIKNNKIENTMSILTVSLNNKDSKKKHKKYNASNKGKLSIPKTYKNYKKVAAETLEMEIQAIIWIQECSQKNNIERKVTCFVKK